MANFKWRDNHISKFLELYQREECVWNVKSENYKNLTLREKSYENIRSGMEIDTLTINDIKNKIKSIRTTYKVELNKVLKANKSGAGTEDVYKPKLFWFAQADVFLRSVSVPRKSHSNLVFTQTQDEDHIESGPLNPDFEPQTPNSDETNNLQEDQRSENNIETPSTSKGKATTNTKRVCSFAQQPLPKRKRKVTNSMEETIDKLQNISDQCKEPEDDEFDHFCKSLACQLKKMPLERALVCQGKLQSVMTQERLHQITYASSPQYTDSSGYSADTSSYSNSPPLQQYMLRETPQHNTNSTVCSTEPSAYLHSPSFQPSQDIITQAFTDI